MSPPRIRVLPSELADQIAAGEVVERPASVVKELAENALDAGARKVEIAIEGGGLSLIQVSDDGSGMSPEEAHLALRRHATSKLRALDDLFSLSTMGFRGEALPSIAAVSRLSLTTRAADAEAGEGAYRLEVAAGIAGEARQTGAPNGTTLEIRELFANVPARLKFMKAESTESAHVTETVLRLALAHPQIHFKLRSQGRQVLDLPPHGSGLERARVALGRGSRTPVALHLACGEEAGVHVEAYLGSPAESAGTSRGTYPFVNRRFVRDRGLLQAIVMGYHELLDRGRYPLAVVHLTVPGAAVDVNVHPQKLEVRFARPQEVYAAVRHAIAQSVAKAPWLSEGPGAALTVYSLPPASRGPFAGNSAGRARDGGEPVYGYAERSRRAAEALKLFAPPPTPTLPGFYADASNSAAQNDAIASNSPPDEDGREADRFFSSLVYLGQLDRTYLVCEAPGELVLIDQHAAHERVAFQRLREAHGKRQVRAQRLLLPAPLQLDESLTAAALEHAALLAELGFEIAPAPGGLVVQAMPESLAQAEPAEVLVEVLDELRASAATAIVSDHLDHLLATMACHSVVRAGDALSAPEVRALLHSMDGIDYRAHCPHGRPVLLRLSIGELERRFGRS
ncbi:MAG TPA: DNA mismatch repair endonuclease MutL [Polyangia bacterium]